MQSNQIFTAYLNAVCPEISKSIRKKKEDVYETYSPINKVGHKFVYNTNKQEIAHSFLRTTYMGGEYGKEIATEFVKVEHTEKGFRTIRI